MRCRRAAPAAALLVALTACSGDSSAGPPTPTPLGPAPTPVLQVDELVGEQTSLALDAAFLQALAAVGGALGPVGDALVDGTTVGLPITGGSLTAYDPASGVAPSLLGLLAHEGSGLALDGGAEVTLTDLVVDLEEGSATGTVSVDGAVVADDAWLLSLDRGATGPVVTDDDLGTATLPGTTATLTAQAADLLTAALGGTALAEGLTVGVAEITVALPAP